MSLESFILGILLMLLCAFLTTEFLKAFYHKKFKRALIFKGLASSCFVVLGFVNLIQSEFSIITLMIFIGLCFGILGDEIIALCQIFPNHDTRHFVGGGACFIVGHLFYILSLIMLGGTNFYAVAASFLIITLLCVIYENRRKFLVGKMKTSLKLYIGIIVLFTAIGIGTFLKRGTLGTALFALGAALFTISDNVLFAFKFGARPRYYQNVLLHIAYYLAQFVIAFSIACI